MKINQAKICLLGDFAVGKTSLARKYVEGRFDDKYLSTIGVKISRKVLERDGRRLNLILWDLAGGEQFNNYQSSYLSGAVGGLIVCDLTRLDSLARLYEYHEQFRQVNPGVAIVCVGNKVDLVDRRQITDQQLDEACSILHSPYLLTSAKTGEQVELAMQTLADLIEK